MAPGGERVATCLLDNDAAGALVSIWDRKRPEYWWGVAWLPEFWLTVVLGVGLVVSVWRDQRLLNGAT